MDSVFFGHYYSNVELKNWRNFEIVDLVSGTLVRKTYTIGATDRFRAINGRISRLFLDEILENPAHRVALEYYLNGNRINSKADAFRLATLDWEIDDIIIEISDSRDTCKVNIVFH